VIDHEEKDERPGTVDVAPISDEKIDINQKAIKTESQKSILDDIEEYEKRLLKKFKK
jgi:hypothetical protein